MKSKVKWYGYRIACLVTVVYIVVHFWISGFLQKSTPDSISVQNTFVGVTLAPRDIIKGRGEIAKAYKDRNGFIYTPGRLPSWDSRSLMSNATNKTYDVFRQTLSQDEFLTLIDILKAFKTTCESTNLTYMLYGGSVIGAYRHAGLIPWDDDVDVWMDEAQKETALKTLSKIQGYSLHPVKNKTNLWTLTRDITDSKQVTNDKKKLFPFVHIIFYADNSTHIRDTDNIVSKRTVFPKSDIFPPKKVLFEDGEYFVPKDILAVMKRKYGQVDLCTPRMCANSTVSVPCEKLFKFYPFITRTKENNTQVERLMFDGKVLWEKVSV